MSPEAQRTAIAESCGWHSLRWIPGEPNETRLWGHPANLKQTSLPTELVPDYLTDLNAIHEAVASQAKMFRERFNDVLFAHLDAKGLLFCEGTAKDWADVFVSLLPPT